MRSPTTPSSGTASGSTGRVRRPATRRSWVLGTAAAVLAAGAVVGLVLGPGAGPTGATGAGPTSAGAAVLTDSPAVDTLLHDHAAALLRRDRAGFAAGLADNPAAATFRATQLAAFDHTEGVPFASFDLRFDRAVLDDVSLAAARTRLDDDTAALVRADLTYAYAGVDARPATHVVYLTLVRHDDGWRLAGDTDLESAGGVSWRGPWDFGPLVVARGATCVVLLHPATDDTADVVAAGADAAALAGDVDAAATAVTGVWGTRWPQRVGVVVAATQPEMDAVAGPGYPLDAVAAVAAAEPTTAVTEGPDVAAGQRIVLSGPALPTVSAAGRSVLLRHELTHVATRDVTALGTPTWVVEGFADLVGNLAGTQPVRTVAAELVAEVAATGPPTALPADIGFVPTATSTAGSGEGATDGTTDGTAGGTSADPGTSGTAGGDRTAAAAYEQAWFAYRTIAALGGPDAPAAFYRAVNAAVAAGTDPAAAVDAALVATTGVDTATFTARWRATVAAELS